ncbi:MAG TPA: hypothetical protein VFZ09_41875 [Archangium sp.]|uniref:hypothetical protein n=1 Tax=Archangium sp. TaxID=1872627 RepID=UPI002E36114A|nr:hypothetical protein [Archangium sp.]HEX5752828.1 hypothetical protein [Archangium sp.]
MREGEVLAVGDVHLTVWASPGHTADALVLVMEDRVLTGDTLVFPAHDDGGRTFSTIGHERLTNPRLRLDHEAFIRLMTSPRAEKPARLEEALAYNTRPREARDEPAGQMAVF